jgi:hypothetical protein
MTGRVSQKPEGSAFDGLQDHPIMLFYAQHAEWKSGHRIGTSEFRDAYLEWSALRRMPAVHFKELRREMQRLGHRHIHSNRMWFADVALLDQPRIGAELEKALSDFRARSNRGEAIDHVDALSRQLAAMRRDIAELRRHLDLPVLA